MSDDLSGLPDGRVPAQRAVFISYASQDRAAAEIICEALRAGGVEVWFDRTELRGGEAWDQSIKRRIRECALFVPVVSAATQARREGYFRREWKLAVERTHDMDDGVPFLLPISLAAVRESDAFVPEAFLRVQWTKLPTGEVPPAFVSRVRALLADQPAARAVPAEAAGAAPAERAAGRDGRRGMPSWAKGVIAVLGVSAGLAFAVRGVLRERPAKRPAPAPEQTAVGPAATTPPEAQAPKLEASRLVLARFENLTGDPKFDGVARLIENELVRGIAAAPQVRILPVEAAGRTAAREAARKEKAASVILGAYFREGENLAVTAEVMAVEEGALIGTIGPVTVPAGVRGEAWTEFVERLTTGANNAGANLDSEPLRVSGLVYTRPWPRWPVAQQLQQVRAAAEGKDAAATLADFRALLAEAPELLKARIEIARVLRSMNRLDEAEKEFNELLAMRAQLSASEIYEITYDVALLQGKPEVALQAARGMIAIRDTRTEITQLLACLWALNRPRQAYEEIAAWWERLKPRVPEEQRLYPQIGVMASRIAADLAHGDITAAEREADAMREYAKGRQIPTVSWVEMRVLAMQGRLDALKTLLAEVGALPAGARVEPAMLGFYAQGILRHGGFEKEAAAIDAFLIERVASLPESVRESDQLAEVVWYVATLEKRYDEVLRKIDNFRARALASPVDLQGYRALTLLKQGREAEWRALDGELAKTDPRNQRGATYYWRARLAAANGERKRAADLLEQAVANGLWFRSFQGGMSDYGRIEPEFAALRGYAPYDLLLKPQD